MIGLQRKRRGTQGVCSFDGEESVDFSISTDLFIIGDGDSSRGYFYFVIFDEGQFFFSSSFDSNFGIHY